MEIPFTELAEMTPALRPQAITLILKSPSKLSQRITFLMADWPWPFNSGSTYVQLSHLLRPFLLQAIHEENERICRTAPPAALPVSMGGFLPCDLNSSSTDGFHYHDFQRARCSSRQFRPTAPSCPAGCARMAQNFHFWLRQIRRIGCWNFVNYLQSMT